MHMLVFITYVGTVNILTCNPFIIIFNGIYLKELGSKMAVKVPGNLAG